MIIFQWNRDLELGVDLIDQQHKQILQYANAFFISHKCGASQSKALDSLNFLKQYVLYHFQAEEAFQSEYCYPKYRDHQAKHAYLKNQFSFYLHWLQEENFAKDPVDQFCNFFKKWIVNHILEDDIEFARFYREHCADSVLECAPFSHELAASQQDAQIL